MNRKTREEIILKIAKSLGFDTFEPIPERCSDSTNDY